MLRVRSSLVDGPQRATLRIGQERIDWGQFVTRRIVVKPASEFPPGTREIIQVGRQSIGVFNVDGEYFALRNHCPHQGAPLCLGRLMGKVTADVPFQVEYSERDTVVKCPWHGWEFDITSGESVFNPHRVRVRSYEVTVEPAEDDEDEEDPTVDTYPVTVEDGLVILHV